MKKGTKMFWMKDGTAAYEKQSDDDFAWWLSCDGAELMKPQEKRYGFRLNDELVVKYYGSFMNFSTTN